MVSKTDAIEIITYAEENDINIWIDGGWGVDALLEEETRVHLSLIHIYILTATNECSISYK